MSRSKLAAYWVTTGWLALEMDVIRKGDQT